MPLWPAGGAARLSKFEHRLQNVALRCSVCKKSYCFCFIFVFNESLSFTNTTRRKVSTSTIKPWQAACWLTPCTAASRLRLLCRTFVCVCRPGCGALLGGGGVLRRACGRARLQVRVPCLRAENKQNKKNKARQSTNSLVWPAGGSRGTLAACYGGDSRVVTLVSTGNRGPVVVSLRPGQSVQEGPRTMIDLLSFLEFQWLLVPDSFLLLSSPPINHADTQTYLDETMAQELWTCYTM